MKETTQVEVDVFVTGYAENKIVPICGEEVSHSTRYWTIDTFLKLYKKEFPIATLCRHFGISPKIFESGKRKKNEGNLLDFAGLSPAEFNKTTYKSVVKAYGRPQDKQKWL